MLNKETLAVLRQERERFATYVNAIDAVLKMEGCAPEPAKVAVNGKPGKRKPQEHAEPKYRPAQPVNPEPKQFMTKGRADNYVARMKELGVPMSIRPHEGGWEVRQA